MDINQLEQMVNLQKLALFYYRINFGIDLELINTKEPSLITNIDFNIIIQEIDFKLGKVLHNFVELYHHKIEAFHLHMMVEWLESSEDYYSNQLNVSALVLNPSSSFR